MLYKQITIHLEEGLKSKAAATFVKTAGKFDSQILIESGNKKINAKSIMGILSLNIKQGDSIYLLINGRDENAAMEALEQII